MITDKLIHTVIVTRPELTGVNDFGENTYTDVEVYNGIKARVEMYQPKMDFNNPGQRPKSEIIVYFDKNVVIKPRDNIKALHVPQYENGNLIGLVKEVVPALLGRTNIVHHYEVRLDDETEFIQDVN